MSKLREKLAQKIEESFPGYKARAEDLIPATGSWRTNIDLDVYRWEGFVTDDYGIRRFIGSYETMTRLVKCKKLTFIGLDGSEIGGQD